MKNQKSLLLALALTVPAILVSAQDRGAGRPGGGPARGERPPHQLLAGLDANQDGSIDADEAAGIGALLLTLDANGDGQVTLDELRPAAPEGTPRGPGGPGGPGGPRGPKGPRGFEFDANQDGVIDAAELENAGVVLMAKDQNGDGVLTKDELRPAGRGLEGRPPGRRGGPKGDGPGMAEGDDAAPQDAPERGPRGQRRGRGPMGPPTE